MKRKAVALGFVLILLVSAVSAAEARVIVIGFDGMDAKLASTWMDEGKLPHFAQLRDEGTYSSLLSTQPPESPVAWSSFSTGMNPGKHGIFDFLSHDFNTYKPGLGLVNVEPRELKIFGHKITDLKPKLSSNRDGKAVWTITAENGIKTVALQAPISFPPDEVPGGKLIGGLGIPDIRGTMGTFHYFAEDFVIGDNEFSGELKDLYFEDGAAKSYVVGPKDIKIPVEFVKNSDSITINVQEHSETVGEGEWSDWYYFKFKPNWLTSIRGIAKFHVISVGPKAEVYLQPISMDPENLFFEISHPKGYAKEMANEIGPYKTLGWAIDTWALNEERIGEDVFIDDMDEVMRLREEMAEVAFEKEDPEFFYMLFQSTDRVQHMFWRYMDPNSPRYEDDPKYKDEILRNYQNADRIVGEYMDKLEDDDVLIVLSDHGFAAYDKSVNINTWLVQNGYMTLTSDKEDKTYALGDLYDQGVFWPNVDWSTTRAYSVGLGNVYINLEGREGQGIVPESEYESLRLELIDGLKGIGDPTTGNDTHVLYDAYRKEDLYNGPYVNHAPDILMGFDEHYRISWQTALGGIPPKLLEDNGKKWSGDHSSMDRHVVMGVLFSNIKLDTAAQQPEITDLAPTILTLFDIEVPSEMDGRSLV